MDDYSDLMELPYPYTSRRKRMALADRAAQFAPFSALAGYEDRIAEKGRLKAPRYTLSEYQQELLDRKIQYLLDSPELLPDVVIHYFQPDLLKTGGNCSHISGKIKQIDILRQQLLFEDGTAIPLNQILDIIVTKQDLENR